MDRDCVVLQWAEHAESMCRFKTAASLRLNIVKRWKADDLVRVFEDQVSTLKDECAPVKVDAAVKYVEAASAQPAAMAVAVKQPAKRPAKKRAKSASTTCNCAA
jgi:hypothetical protein